MSGSVDVLVIGAGPSGAIAAREFASAGFRTVCLEQGEWVRPGDYPGLRPDLELQRRTRWATNPNARLAAADYPVDTEASDISPVMFNGVGGSTILWGAHWHRMNPSDFRTLTLDGVGADWPIGYRDLAPHYDALEAELGISGLAGDPAAPPVPDYSMPPLPIGVGGARMAAAMNALGWHWWPGTNAIPSRPHPRLNPCARLGVCNAGCPEGAKLSADLAIWPEALAAGAELITGARVTELLIGPQGRAAGARWIDRNGVTSTLNAPTVVLCANGIGTPRMMLLSCSGRFPQGLANRSGLVGRGLMLHPFSGVLGTFAEPLDSTAGPAGQLIQSMQFYESDQDRGFVRGGKWSLVPAGSAIGSHPGVAGGAAEGWGDAGQQAVRAAAGRTLMWLIISEDLPDDDNRVTLDPVLTDSDELPAPRVQYRIGENTGRMMEFHLARARESFLAAGASAVRDIPLLRDAAGHLTGTVRMGVDPARSVVDPQGQAHDVPGLYVMDGSVFPTSSGVNPTATIMANARRCARAAVVELAARRQAA